MSQYQLRELVKLYEDLLMMPPEFLDQKLDPVTEGDLKFCNPGATIREFYQGKLKHYRSLLG